MTLVVHWGDGDTSIFDGAQWEVHSCRKELILYNPTRHAYGSILVKDVPHIEGSGAYHVWTDATSWVEA